MAPERSASHEPPLSLASPHVPRLRGERPHRLVRPEQPVPALWWVRRSLDLAGAVTIAVAIIVVIIVIWTLWEEWRDA